MTAALKELEIELDRVGRGDATPAEATETIRSALRGRTDLADRVYEALRDVTWRTLTARSFGDELSQWFDVFLHASALARSNSAELADRIGAFAELLSQSSRFAELQPVKELLTRKHSKAVLKAVAEAGKFIKRNVLLGLVGLAEANLSRVTGALVAQGLITRSSSGKEAHFALTQLGRQAANELGLLVQQAGDSAGWWLNCPFALALWDNEGIPIGANASFQQVTQSSPELPSHSDWSQAVSKSARADRRPTPSTWQVEIGEKKWIQFVEHRLPEGGLVLLAQDVSAQMEEILDRDNRLLVAANAEATLRRQLAESQEHLRAYRIANVQLREKIANAAARSNDRLRHSISLLAGLKASNRVPEELQQLETDLNGVQLAIKYLPDPADIVEAEDTRVEWLDMEQVVIEAVQAFSAINQKVEVTPVFGRIGKVRAPSSSVRTVLGQMLDGAAESGRSDRYTLHTGVEGAQLMAKVTTAGKSKAVTTPGIEGLGYGRAVAKCHGGYLIAGGSGIADICTMSFPVEPETIHGLSKPAKAGPKIIVHKIYDR